MNRYAHSLLIIRLTASAPLLPVNYYIIYNFKTMTNYSICLITLKVVQFTQNS